MTEQNTPKMTHDEMIDVLKGLVFGTFDRTTAKEREALDMAISALSENKGEWMPANVPPKESGRYLTYIVNEYDEKLQYIMTADYIARPTPIEGLSPWYVDDECASDNVVAWQPLPEPYKAESEGE